MLALAYANIPIWSLALGFLSGQMMSRFLWDVHLPRSQSLKGPPVLPYSALIILLLPSVLLLGVCADYVKERSGSLPDVLFGILFVVPFAFGMYKGSKKWLNRYDSDTK